MLAAAPVMGLLAAMIGLGLGDAMSSKVLVVFAVIFLGMGAALLSYTWFLVPFIATQATLRSPELRAQTIGPRAFNMSEGGVAYRYPAGESSVAWAGVNRVERDSAAVYIYFGPASAVWLPRRAFATDEEFVRFGELATQYLAASRGLAPAARPAAL